MPSMSQGAERRAAANQTGTGTPKTTIGQRRAGRKRGNDPNGPGRDWNSKIGAKKRREQTKWQQKQTDVLSVHAHTRTRAHTGTRTTIAAWSRWSLPTERWPATVWPDGGTAVGAGHASSSRRTRVLFTPDARPLLAGLQRRLIAPLGTPSQHPINSLEKQNNTFLWSKGHSSWFSFYLKMSLYLFVNLKRS